MSVGFKFDSDRIFSYQLIVIRLACGAGIYCKLLSPPGKNTFVVHVDKLHLLCGPNY